MWIKKISKSVSLHYASRSIFCSSIQRKNAGGKEGKGKEEKGKDEKKVSQKSCEWDWSSCRTMVKVRECHDDLCAIDKSIKQPCVVIIGGGIAGLSAAARLSQCGLTNFRLLEATDRPGGRLKSCWLGDTVVELGAQYILGSCVANKVFTLAALEQLIKYPLDRVDHHCGIFLTSCGKAVPKDLVRKGLEIYYSFISKAADLFMYGESSSQACLSLFFDDAISNGLKDVDDEDKCEVSRVLYGLSNCLRVKLGADLGCVGTQSYGSYRQLPGGDIIVKSGLAGVLAPLLKPLPNCGVTYCKPVATIKWGTAGSSLCPRAIVVTEDNEEFPADYVIVTVSLGVLKVMSDCLFCPGLPANKMDAINSLGFGNVNKVFLQYEKPFWSDKGGNIDLAWTAEELANKDDWTKGISSFSPVFGSKNVLQTTIGGPEAKTFELCTDEDVANGVTGVLRKFTGDPSIPEPVEIVRSCWSTDPYFYGSYTYMGIDSHTAHIQALSEPLPDNCFPGDVPPIILFAGEHTSTKHFSTLHGARESGIREADRIINLTKKLHGPPNGDPSCIECTAKVKK